MSIEAIQKKAKESGVSYSILKQVYDRGMGAYRTNPQSVRPNVTSPQQWAIARVNSFLNGGKTQKTADKDLAIKAGLIKENKALQIINLLEEEETFVPPASAAKEAKKAIDWKEEHGDEVKGGTQVGWTRANQLAKRERLSLKTVKRMKAFFDRHEKNKSIAPEFKSEPWRDNGYIAWLIWGGDSARSWVEGILKE